MPDAFTFMIHKRNSDDVCQEDECPVCLKNSSNMKQWIALQCSHDLCDKRFYKIVSRNWLHST